MSGKAKWWIEDKELYRLARYYARMYPKWKAEYNAIGGDAREHEGSVSSGMFKTSDTEREAIRRERIRRKLDKIENAAREADAAIFPWILDAAAYGRTFDEEKAKGLPCEQTMYYEKRRKFYYILSTLL